MLVAMAATYDPNPEAPNGFNLPFDLNTGERINARWRAWLKHDPINLVRANKPDWPSCVVFTSTVGGKISSIFIMDRDSYPCSLTDTASPIAMRNLPGHTQASITGWMSACRFSPNL